MKKLISALLLVTMLFTLAACGGNADTASNAVPSEASTQTPETPEVSSAPETTSQPEESASTTGAQESNTDAESSSNVLIAYFSRAGDNIGVGVVETGNTQIIAEMIAEQNGGTLFHIETVVPYPENYRECTEYAQQEKNNNARPELTASIENMDDYDVVFLGYPNWWGDMPMAVYTFLESYDFSGKTIIPFCTHEGSGLSNTVQSIGTTCPGAEVLNGLSLRGTTAQNSRTEAKEAVVNWLAELGLSE